MEKHFMTLYDLNIDYSTDISEQILLKSLFYSKNSNNQQIYRVLASTKTTIFIYQVQQKNQLENLKIHQLKLLQRLHLNLTFQIIQEKNQLKYNQSLQTKFVFYSSFIKMKEFYTKDPQTIRVWREFLQIYFNQYSFNTKFSQFLKLQNKEYCTFYEAISAQTNKKVLIKAFSKQIVYCSYVYKTKLTNQIKVLRMLHEHEIKILLSVYETQNSIYLILQSEITSLQKFLKNKNLLSIHNVQTIIYSIISQIMKLHSCKITYQNLNIQNIYLNPNKIQEKYIQILNFQNSQVFQSKQNNDEQIVRTQIFQTLKQKDMLDIETLILILNNYIIPQKHQKRKQIDENGIQQVNSQSKLNLQVKQIYSNLCNNISRKQKISKFKGLKQNKQLNLSKRVY